MQPHHQNPGRRIPDFQPSRFRFVARQRFHEFVVDDFDDLVARRNRFHHRLASRFLLRRPNECPDDRQSHIGFKERDTDFPHRSRDFVLGQRTFSRELVQNGR